MARKIIKAILFILAAVVVAGGIMTYLRSQKKVTSPLQTQTEKTPQQAPVKSSEIQQVTVSGQGQNAQVQIKGINEHNYNIQHIASGDGFKILVPNAQIGQVKPLLDKPHPLIKKITVHTSPDNPSMAELVFETQKDVNFLDTQKNDTLTIDFVKAEGTVEDKMGDSSTGAAVADKGTSKTKVTGGGKSSSSSTLNDDFAGTTSSKSSKSAATSKSSKTSKKKAAAVAKSSKKSKKSSSVKLKPFVPDEDVGSDFDDSSLNNLAADEQGSINDMKNSQTTAMNDFGGTTAPATEPMLQEDAPTIAEPSAPKKNTDAEEGFMNLNDVVKEEPKAPKGNANLLDAETEMSLNENMGKSADQKMAALPNQKIDVNQLKANLPALQSMNVTRSGNNTVVTFDREKSIPFKVFRMVNPSRVVVDFKDAKSNLKSDYPRFTGTKISRIETREYAGMDGLLVRVIMYVDGAPNFTSNKNGNQLVIELQ